MATRRRTLGPLKWFLEGLCEVPPVAETLCDVCVVNLIYLCFTNGRLEPKRMPHRAFPRSARGYAQPVDARELADIARDEGQVAG